MHTLSIDIETFSAADLPTVGLYKYVECDQFEILLFAYSVDYGTVQVIDLASGERLPEHILFALTDDRVLKTAFNAAFERICIQKQFGISLPVSQWECTMVKAAMCGLPMSLKAVGAALNLPVQKDSSGTALIKFFSMVCRPTSRNGMRHRNYPLHDFIKWQEFKSYCIRDVEAENAIRKKLDFFQMPETEKKLYILDQQINDTGIALDPAMVENAMEIYRSFSESLMAEATEITGLENPNSDAQIKQWIADTDGYETASLNKAVMAEVRDAIDNDTVHRVLDIREQLSKSSVKKYEAMSACMTVDNRAHGLLQFYGANRTGRWSGRLIQIQNLPRINERSIALARQVVLNGDGGLLHLLYGNVPDILSQLIRTAFVPSSGCRFIVADFSAIEARVIAWLAGERWRLEVFATHGKIYEASAAQMFGVPVESIGKDSPLRQKGKVAELALGYQGGPGALVSMGALNMGLTEDELPEIVSRWRNSNKAVVKLWGDMESAAINALDNPGAEVKSGRISFKKVKGYLCITLPSGRTLYYADAALKPNRFNRLAISYSGMNQTTKKREKTDTYGGKIVENVVQGIARDLLAEALLRLDTAGYRIVAHIHDEVILDVPEGFGSLEEVIKLITINPVWASGLPLAADGFEVKFYQK